MKKVIFKLIGIVSILFTQEQTYASQQLRTLTYEDVRGEGGFNSSTLTDVETLSPGGRNLGEEEIVSLVNSSSLTNLRVLDLTNQPGINDAFIEQLVLNTTFSRITTLWLEGTQVTDSSIDKILNSRVLGSIRDYPFQSEKHNAPSSTIAVHARGTKVTDRLEPQVRQDFHIEYKPLRPTYPWGPVDHGVKIVLVEAW
jgi:hypothetical protein